MVQFTLISVSALLAQHPLPTISYGRVPPNNLKCTITLQYFDLYHDHEISE